MEQSKKADLEILVHDQSYACPDCGWMGAQSDVEFDTVESCMGPDRIETCPQCGSMAVRRVYSQN